MNPKKTPLYFFMLLFIFSGLSGIVYEIIWVRYFGLMFGNTVFASSTVLSVFMAGLALGSWLLGKYVDRRGNPLVIYMLLELGIGLFALLVPLAVQCVTPIYAFLFRTFNPSFFQLSIIRVFVSFLILIVPCTLMGGTLPAISKFVADASGKMPEKQSGLLYAVNTLGAAAGSLISGYCLIGNVGLFGTTAIAAALNSAIAAAVFIYGRKLTPRPAAPSGNKPGGKIPVAAQTGPSLFAKSQVRLVIALYGVSGFLSLFLEVAWTRALVWVMGMDAYAFASMLAIFLFGLALGSLAVSWFFKSPAGAVFKLGIIEALIGVSVVASAFLLSEMYVIMHSFERHFSIASFWGSCIFLLAQAATIMAGPALLMGMAFPLALTVSLKGGSETGSGVGAVYAANTIGSVLGALAAGFLALPLIGVMKSIVIAGGLFLLVASVFLAASQGFRKRAMNAAAGLLAAAGIVLAAACAPSFEKALSAGLNESERLIYFKETITGDVQVTETPFEGRILRVDGRQVASDGPTDLPSHSYPAHLVSLLKRDPARALFIAFGAGGTAGTILRYNELDRLDVVEICGGVVEPARRFFERMNYRVLDDPRLHLIIQDGKNYVRLTDKTYDIIYSGPIHPQSNQGSAALYTKDFFIDCRKRLSAGGIHCVWLPLHLPPDDYKLIVKTFIAVYPHSSLWMTTASPNTISHTHLVGSPEPLAIDYGMVSQKLREPEIIADLGRLEYVPLRSGLDFIGQCAMGEEKLREFTAGVEHVNTDNMPRAEYYRKIGKETYKNRDCPALLLADIVRYKENCFRYAVNVPDSEARALEEKCALFCTGDSLRILGHINTILSNVLAEEAKGSRNAVDMNKAFQYFSGAYRAYSDALRYLPDDAFLKDFFAEAAKVSSQPLRE